MGLTVGKIAQCLTTRFRSILNCLPAHSPSPFVPPPPREEKVGSDIGAGGSDSRLPGPTNSLHGPVESKILIERYERGLSEIFMECEENLLSKDNIFVLLMLAGLHVSFRETR